MIVTIESQLAVEGDGVKGFEGGEAECCRGGELMMRER